MRALQTEEGQEETEEQDVIPMLMDLYSFDMEGF